MLSTDKPVSPLSAPVITVYVRHHKDCPHSHNHFYRGKGCNCRKRLRWTQNGKWKDVSAKTRSWPEAERAKRKIEDQLTVARAIELFLMSKSGQVASDVLKKYERELKRLEDFLSKRSKFTLEGIDAEDIIEFQASWKDYKSKQTRRRVITRYRAFFRYCAKRKWMTDAPEFDKVPKDTPSDVPTMSLSEKQYAKLLATIPETFTDARKAQRVHALVQLMRFSGLSIRDAVTLERTELVQDTHAKRKGKPHGEVYRVVTSRQKTGTHVSVPIPPEVAAEVLAAMELNENKVYAFWNSGTGKPQSAVTNWQHDLRELFRAAGFPEGHPHMLRDTFAVRLLEKGVPLLEVSRALGHESTQTTEKHYAPWIKERQDRLDSLIQGTW
jgi:integrase/recombinase XerD